MANYYKMGDETIEGLGVVNIHTERGDSRLISNIVLQSEFVPAAYRWILRIMEAERLLRIISLLAKC